MTRPVNPLLLPRATRLRPTPPGAEPRYVVRRAPLLEPPFDDEMDPHDLLVAARADQLPFDKPAARQLAAPVDVFDPQPTARRNLPDPGAWSRTFARAALEALVGRRPIGQLREWTSPVVFVGLSRAVGQPRWRGSDGRPPLVRSVRVCEPADGVAEVAVVVQRGNRCAALAARLEGIDGRWRCVALQIG